MVKFAPLNIPLRRRMQTGAVCLMVSALPLIVCACAAVLLIPTPFYLRELFLLYTLWTILLDSHTPVTGGRRWTWFVQMRVWSLVREYFPSQLHVTAGVTYDASRPHVFAFHPHGIISLGLISNIMADPGGTTAAVLPPYRCLTVSANMLLPVWRELLMWLGFVSARAESGHYCLKHGLSAVIVVGGALESLDAHPGAADLTLKKRKGFVRLALQHGAPLVPGYIFNENCLYSQLHNPRGGWLRRMQLKAIKLVGFTLPLAHGRGVFQYSYGILPRRAPLHAVLGRPLEVPHLPHPTPEEVSTWHDKYCAALAQLYEENVGKYGLPGSAPKVHFVE